MQECFCAFSPVPYSARNLIVKKPFFNPAIPMTSHYLKQKWICCTIDALDLLPLTLAIVRKGKTARNNKKRKDLRRHRNRRRAAYPLLNEFASSQTLTSIALDSKVKGTWTCCVFSTLKFLWGCWILIFVIFFSNSSLTSSMWWINSKKRNRGKIMQVQKRLQAYQSFKTFFVAESLFINYLIIFELHIKACLKMSVSSYS